jgi:3-methyladenine DNA glycosylase AlkC
MADIPRDVLAALNAGEIETKTLVEWLAIDVAALLRAALPEVVLEVETRAIVAEWSRFAGEGVTRRVKGAGAALHGALAGSSRRAAILDRLARHPSDMARAFSCYATGADASLGLEARLAAARRFAADGAMSVRECAWDAMRPHLAADLERGIRLLRPWVGDADANVRRCAVEATRPRGVWTAHIEALKRDPEPARPLLEPVRSDASLYVRNAVGNWLNDASKTRADWVTDLGGRWSRASGTAETAYIVKRALRTIRQGGSGRENRRRRP